MFVCFGFNLQTFKQQREGDPVESRTSSRAKELAAKGVQVYKAISLYHTYFEPGQINPETRWGRSGTGQSHGTHQEPCSTPPCEFAASYAGSLRMCRPRKQFAGYE